MTCASEQVGFDLVEMNAGSDPDGFLDDRVLADRFRSLKPVAATA
ncbi:hypothetical protein OG792_17920 [Micromonospora sp. NBC_01699]|nr:hypothetical protein [Micromonospora sp. NBC_01699]